MTTTASVNGTCDSRFEGVRAAFAENFASRGDVGASLAVMVDGEMVVDLWGGSADKARTRPWEQDTIVNVYSATKGMTSICAHRLAEQGLLDFDAPVAKYWPEFAQAGKEELPVRYLLSHRAGLPALRETLPSGSILDWDTMTAALAAEEPWWKPGTEHGYHAVTFGWLVGEVVRRITGKSLGTYFREEVAEPLGLEFYIGFGPELDSKVAEIIQVPPPPPGQEYQFFAETMSDPNSIAFKSYVLSDDDFDLDRVNTRPWRAMELPSINGHANGRALARAYGALARGGELDGVHVLSPAAIEAATVEQSHGIDLIQKVPSRIGLGFMLTMPEIPFGPNPRSFGHGGMGGSLGFADPDTKVGFGYAMNQMLMAEASEDIIVDARWVPMIDAVYAAL